jgi:hypothetical protein
MKTAKMNKPVNAVPATHRLTAESEQLLINASGMVKMVTGIANNAAWAAMLEAYDHAKKCKRYKQDVKRAFKGALSAFQVYERELLSPYGIRFFHMADMPPETRKKYGNITDEQYYEYWKNTGAQAYVNTRDIVTSLVNKYRKSLLQHGVNDAEHVAWVMMAQAALELSLRMYDVSVMKVHEATNISIGLLNLNFRILRLTLVTKQWRKALALISPDSEDYDLDKQEERDIELGLEQLEEAWASIDNMFDSTIKTVADYEEIFRTKGENKKAQRQLAEMREEILQEL